MVTFLPRVDVRPGRVVPTGVHADECRLSDELSSGIGWRHHVTGLPGTRCRHARALLLDPRGLSPSQGHQARHDQEDKDQYDDEYGQVHSEGSLCEPAPKLGHHPTPA